LPKVAFAGFVETKGFADLLELSRPLDRFERARAVTGDRVQPLAVFIAEKDADCLSHEPRLARPTGL
jgi:hypothetical protein